MTELLSMKSGNLKRTASCVWIFAGPCVSTIASADNTARGSFRIIHGEEENAGAVYWPHFDRGIAHRLLKAVQPLGVSRRAAITAATGEAEERDQTDDPATAGRATTLRTRSPPSLAHPMPLIDPTSEHGRVHRGWEDILQKKMWL
jgi:hypothetical protein